MVIITLAGLNSIIEQATSVLSPELKTSFYEQVYTSVPRLKETISQSSHRVSIEEASNLGHLLYEWLKKNKLASNPEAQAAVSELQTKLLTPLLNKPKQLKPKETDLHTILKERFPTTMEKIPVKLGPDVDEERYQTYGFELGPELLSSKFHNLALKIAELANLADNEGLIEEADKLSSVLSRIGLLKLAQYEGVQHYWIQNGRAFEKAWKEKRKLKATDDSEFQGNNPDFYKSAHECWWETLQEYQDSLNGNHEEWLSKYASKEKNKKDNKEEENASMSGGSTTMSEAMEKQHKKMEEEGGTPGEGIVNWLNEQNKKVAGYEFINRIAKKIEEGLSPGVAFYSSNDEMIAGNYVQDIILDISKSIENIKKASKNNDTLQKVAQISDFLQNMWTGVKGYTGIGGGAGKGKWETGKVVALIQNMRKVYPQVIANLNAISNFEVNRLQFRKIVSPFVNIFNLFLKEVEKSGMKPTYPDLDAILGEDKTINPEITKDYLAALVDINRGLGEDLALIIQERQKEKQKRQPQELPRKQREPVKPIDDDKPIKSPKQPNEFKLEKEPQSFTQERRDKADFLYQKDPKFKEKVDNYVNSLLEEFEKANQSS